MKALVFEDVVVQLEETEFPVHPSMVWMDAPVGCETGWVLDTGVLVAPTDPTMSIEDEIKEYSKSLKDKLNQKAAEKDYDCEMSIMSYTNSGVTQWKSEADQFNVWRDAVWNYAFGVYNAWIADPNTKPSLEDFLANAPDLTWA